MALAVGVGATLVVGNMPPLEIKEYLHRICFIDCCSLLLTEWMPQEKEICFFKKSYGDAQPTGI